MEIIIQFKKADFSDDGTHLISGKFIMDLQHDWEASFHDTFPPYYANVIEGHPLSMLRLTKYMDAGEETDYDFGMELIDGEIDIDTNIAIGKHSDYETVFAIGSMLHDMEDEPLFLVKNENLADEILVLKYVPDDEGEENEKDNVPAESIAVKT